MLKPLSNFIILEIKSTESTKSGLILTEQREELRGKVIATGKDVQEVKIGDEVIFDKLVAIVDGYAVIRESNVLVIL